MVYMFTNNVNISKESRIMQPSKMCDLPKPLYEKQIISNDNDFR